jgi:hypothetical protein
MWTRSRVLLLVALVAVLVAPVGFALSLESVPPIGPQTYRPAAPMAAAVTAPVTVRRDTSTFLARQGLDAAGLLMVGTALFGLAAVVRRAV